MQKDTLMHARTGGGGACTRFQRGPVSSGASSFVLTTVFFWRVKLRTERGRSRVARSPPGGDNKPNIKEHERSFSRGASEVASAIKDVTSLQEVVAPLRASRTVGTVRQ